MDVLITTILTNTTAVITDLIAENWVAILTIVLGVAVISVIAKLLKRAPAKIFGGN